MKKILFAILAIIIAISLTACARRADDANVQDNVQRPLIQVGVTYDSNNRVLQQTFYNETTRVTHIYTYTYWSDGGYVLCNQVSLIVVDQQGNIKGEMINVVNP